jgi:hypothetical protein
MVGWTFFPLSHWLQNELSGETTNSIQLGRIREADYEFLDASRLIGGYTPADSFGAPNKTI